MRRASAWAAGAALAAAAAALAGAAARPIAAGAGERLMVARTPAVEALAASGRIRILDSYGPPGGGRLLVEGSRDIILPALAAAPGTPPPREVRPFIHLRGRAIDTSARRAAPVSFPHEGHLEVIQFSGPIKPAWLAALRARRGVRPLSYVPNHAYLVWVEGDEDLHAAAPVAWREALAAKDRLSGDLAGREGIVEVSIQVARTPREEETVQAIRTRAEDVTHPPRPVGHCVHLRARMPAAALEEIAALPDVVWIEPFDPPSAQDERSALIVSGFVSSGRPLPPGHEAWLEAHGLGDLSAQVVDVTDTGIDTGDPGRLHPGLRGRLAYVTNASSEADPQDCAGHGTNIAGIIGGARVPGFETRDPEGYLYGLGLAPTVRLGATRLFDCAGTFDQSVSFSELLDRAWTNGARIGNNSWGGLGTQYNVVTAEYDALTRDVNLDPGDGDQSFLPIFSAGNFGPLAGSVGWPSTAKNVISVGGTEGYRPNVSDGCGASNLEADSADHIATLSARGPSGDGRVKPDLVAPATHIYSLASGALDYNGTGVCDRYHPPGQRLLSWASGTSQAAAHATGAAVLAFDMLRRRTGAPPSPALLKASLINRAHDMRSTIVLPSNTGPRPNGAQGWGRVDIGALADDVAAVTLDQSVVLRSTGESYTMDPIVVEDPARPIVVTLVWTDAPGTPGGWSWVNDLDLIVRSGGSTYLGNVIEGGESVTGGSPDERNNVENVYLPAGQSVLTVEVSAAHLAGDGIPSIPGETDQDFAVYVSNARWPRGAAAVSFGSARASCGAPLTIRVADAGMRGFGRVTVSVSAGGDVESALLRESPAGGAVFTGSLDVAAGQPVPEDGILQIDGAADVTAAYTERDPGSGVLVPRSASVPAKCGPPLITQARVEMLSDSEATLTWLTDRPADSTVSYGVAGGASLVLTDPRPIARHAVRLSGLASCSPYTATVSSADSSGQAASSAVSFTTLSPSWRRRTIFRDDMEGAVSRWTHRALPSAPGTVDDWQLGIPGPGVPRPPAGQRVWATRLEGGYSAGADSVLETPDIDLRGAPAPQLSFWHYHALSGGRSPDSENDGAWVEVSADGGAHWSAIDPVGGYPDTIDADNPWLAAGTGVYAGSAGLWTKALFDLSAQTGQVIRLRFHIWQDASENNPILAGWYVDDVEVTARGSCHEGVLLMDAAEYGCSSRVEVTLWDPDLDRSASQAETVAVTAAAPSGTLDLVLQETAAGSGEFRSAFLLGGIPGRLAVSPGDAISVRYDDARGDEGPSVVTTAASIPECTPPPAPSSVTISRTRPGELAVSWDGIDPAAAPDLQGYRVHYDSDASGPVYAGIGAQQGPSPVRTEGSAMLQSLGALAACAPYYVTVSAFDRLGNEGAFAAEVFAMPTSGSGACQQGRVLLSPDRPGCRQTIAITVTDANADPDAGANGRITVRAASGVEPAGIPVELTETGPATGTFVGGVALSPVPAAGKLASATDDLITVIYLDTADGSGNARQAAASVRAGDCDAPVISSLALSSRASDRALVTWTTDEPATSRVRFGSDPALPRTEEPAPGTLATQHAVLLTGLTPCSTVYYDVTSADALFNTATQPGGSGVLRFGTWRELPLYLDDLESGAPGWTHASLSPLTPDEWELGTPPVPEPGVTLIGPGASHSGAAVWGTDLDHYYESHTDLVLISPPIDLASKETITLSFWHWYEIRSEPGPPDGFDDGAFVEISRDAGATWEPVEPVGGYPDRISGGSYLPFASGAWGGASAGWVPASFVLDEYAGETVQVRFHLLGDPIEANFPPRAGWYIDDVRVSFSVACHEGSLNWDLAAYGCGDQPARLRLMDQDLDTPGLDTADVLVRSQAEPAGETITLQESEAASGVFEGEILLSASDAPGRLHVMDGDTVTATYEDADDGTGATAAAQAKAAVGDCAPPLFSGVRVTRAAPTSFRVQWSTSEPADSAVLYGTGASYGQSVRSPALVSDHDLTVTGLSPCGDYLFTVESADALGNLAREDAVAGPRSVSLSTEAAIMSEGFGAGAPGWTRTGRAGAWTVSGGMARSSAGTPSRPESSSTLITMTSPGFDLSGTAHPVLALRHAYDFSFLFSGGDGAWVEGWDGIRWILLEPEGGYPGWVDPEAGRTGRQGLGFAGASQGFVRSRFDLSPLAARGGGEARVRLRVFVARGSSPVGDGWQVDEAVVSDELSCHAGRVGFDPVPLTCAATAAGVVVHDRDLDRDPDTPDTAPAVVTSSGGGTPAAVALTETAPSSGVFRGAAPLDPAGAGASPRSAAGDEITATYQDDDDGAGQSAVRQRRVTVQPCDVPVVRSLSAAPLSDGTVAVTWLTDQPSTSDATLSPASGEPIEAGDPALVTSHRVLLDGLTACTPYAVTVRSRNAVGVAGAGPAAPSPPSVVETIARDVVFFDDMEGPDPGWTRSGIQNDWERGVPVLVGPAAAFSGTSVWATDLDDFYDAAANAVLTSPPIDLRNVDSARLSFWHWYDVFGNEPPHSFDDAAWVEVLPEGGGPPVYIEPIGGYPDSSDQEGASPLPLGKPAYAGQSDKWEYAQFDLTPFAGRVIRLRFRIWNDHIELLVNLRTGAGWYIDDVEVASVLPCFPAPAITTATIGSLAQGAGAQAVAVDGSGFREGVSVTLGAGVSVSPVSITPTRLVLDLAVDPRAAIGARDLTIVAPDGQSARLPGALSIVFFPRRADLNGSNRVDASDLAILAASFGSMEGEPHYDAAADFNGDGAVDGFDLALLSTIFGISFD